MSSSNNRILKLYKSRKTIIELLTTQGFNVSDYEEFNINEIDAMYAKKQLDLKFTNNDTKKNIYVKYFLDTKQVKPNTLDNIFGSNSSGIG